MKTLQIAAALLSLSMLIGCNSSASKTETAETVTDTIKAVEPAAPDMAKIKEEIQGVENTWAKAYNVKDIETLASMYAEDAVSLPSGNAMQVGREAIKAGLAKEFAEAKGNEMMSFETLDVYGTEEFVTEVGKSSKTDASGKVIATGKYMVVFKKVGDKYLCLREIYNKDK